MINRLQGSAADHDLATSTALSLSVAGVVFTMLTATIATAADLGPAFYAISLSLGCAICGLLVARLPQRLPWNRFGSANCVTLARALLTCLLAGTLGSMPLTGALAWTMLAIAAIALALDGVDGWLARRRREDSAFGARFDMETDALFVLVLSLIVFELEKAGAWVLLSGAMRYLFVAARLAWPWLSRPLPGSRRRQAVCALQAGALVVCLAPIVPATLSAWIALAALMALGLSFTKDVLWLRRTAKAGDAR